MIKNKFVPLNDLEYIKNNINKEIYLLRNKNIYITGASGFFGKWFIETFLYVNYYFKLNLKIFLLLRSPKKIQYIKKSSLYKHCNIKILKIDLTNRQSIKKNLYEKNIDYFIHLASLPYNKKKNWAKKHSELAICGLKNILNVCGNRIKNFFFTSSSVIYYTKSIKDKKPNFSCETYSYKDFLNPKYVYGSCKKLMEEMLTDYSKQMNFKLKIARSFTCYGPHMSLNDNSLISEILLAIIKKKPLILNSTGQSIKSYMYISDSIIYFLKILIKGKSLKTYNVGSSEFISVKNLVKKFIFISKIKIKLYFGLKKKILGSKVHIPNIPNTKKDLDIKSFVSLDKGILQTINWHQDIKL